MKASRILLAVTLFALGACSTTFRSDVSTFHDGAPQAGQTFAITPMNPAKHDSIEYAQYAAAIVMELERKGFTPSLDGADADLLVGFDMVQSEGREQVYTRPAPHPYSVWNDGYGYWGWRAFYRGPRFGLYNNFNYPFGGYGFADEVRTRTVYPTTLFVEMREQDAGKLLFEGRAITEAKSRDTSRTLPLLAQSLFADYPGPSGGTRQVRLILDKDGNVTKEKVKDITEKASGR